MFDDFSALVLLIASVLAWCSGDHIIFRTCFWIDAATCSSPHATKFREPINLPTLPSSASSRIVLITVTHRKCIQSLEASPATTWSSRTTADHDGIETVTRGNIGIAPGRAEVSSLLVFLHIRTNEFLLPPLLKYPSRRIRI